MNPQTRERIIAIFDLAFTLYEKKQLPIVAGYSSRNNLFQVHIFKYGSLDEYIIKPTYISLSRDNADKKLDEIIKRLTQLL